MNILLIEDEAKIAGFVKRGLEAEGFAVSHASDGAGGLEFATGGTFDLVILDLVLPDLRGEDILAELRRRKVVAPVIVLTAKDAVSDRVANLEAGADDYLTKPFSFAELLARIRARLRVSDQPSSSVLEVGDVTLDIKQRKVSRNGKSVDLTAREFSLLETFMRHPNQVLSQTQLLDRVWGYDYDPGSNVVEVYVGYLRKKLGPGVLETVRGAGYRFRVEPPA